MNCRIFAFMACALAALPVVAHAQDYPSRPVTMIVPFPAGGATDVLARLLGEKMKESLGQPVVIENVAGEQDARAQPRDTRARRRLHTEHWHIDDAHADRRALRAAV